MNKTIYQIYDKIFKKILTLSSTAVINLINGLFGTDYPLNSIITYNWTEFEDKELKKILADTILTINGKYSYHLEAQMTEDKDIVFRVFEYGFGHASRNITEEDGKHILPFPEAKVIFLYSEKKAPDEYALTLDFGTQGRFNYRVPTFKFQEVEIEELNRRKMVILIPFALLKLREIMKEERSEENLEALKKLIQDDIIGSINDNLKLGNITVDDARRLRRLTYRLYEHIYAHYEEMEELNDMTDESLMLDIDIIEKEHEKEIARVKKEVTEKVTAKVTEDVTRQISNQKDKEICRLKEEIEQLKKLINMQNNE